MKSCTDCLKTGVTTALTATDIPHRPCRSSASPARMPGIPEYGSPARKHRDHRVFRYRPPPYAKNSHRRDIAGSGPGDRPQAWLRQKKPDRQRPVLCCRFGEIVVRSVATPVRVRKTSKNQIPTFAPTKLRTKPLHCNSPHRTKDQGDIGKYIRLLASSGQYRCAILSQNCKKLSIRCGSLQGGKPADRRPPKRSSASIRP